MFNVSQYITTYDNDSYAKNFFLLKSNFFFLYHIHLFIYFTVYIKGNDIKFIFIDTLYYTSLFLSIQTFSYFFFSLILFFLLRELLAIQHVKRKDQYYLSIYIVVQVASDTF